MSAETFAPFMRRAIELAERGRWHVAPNPTVGAVLVQDGRIVAEGWHANYGEAHAEVRCLDDARSKGVDPAQCTLVVTLEPCNHTGKTPPCVQAVLQAGIRHVVAGMADPTAEAGGGAETLRAHGVRVDMGVEEDACRDLIADFLVWKTTDRPYILLKMAATLDGRIATRTGHSRWISGSAARAEVHRLRAGIGLAGGAVFVGSKTLLADNPALTARDVPLTRQPLAASIMSRLPTSDNLELLKNRPSETILFTTTAGAASPRARGLQERGVRIHGLTCWKDAGGRDLQQAMTWLRQEAGCRYVLCEGGGTLALALLQAALIDEFHLYLSPRVLGDNESQPLFSGRSPQHLEEALPLRFVQAGMLGDDCRLVLRALRRC